ncbi:unnamed protein product [Brassicogethes aeneus]|uniref:Succinate dehydrogenase [ubiquinone] iron-sulfur subunit, mitochondrial n=1 Tax=Brassicogethes aeneus TaxID=1431903 RepID=A0A9P0B0B5_BRAAE|nr:unnamed protein product [Brassicogethes aeneus]
MALFKHFLNPFKSILRLFATAAKPKKSLCKDGGKPPPEKELKPKLKTFQIYRYLPHEGKTFKKSYTLDLNKTGIKVLDALIRIKREMDPTLAFRMSCREGICGSCGMNIDGKNTLACLAPISPKGTTKIYPLPHMYVIRDLVVDMKHFTKQHRRIMPWLIRKEDPGPDKQLLQSVKDRDKIDGRIECILCACCSTSCPEYWWHGHSKDEKDFLGPAALLNAYRWVIDSRDQAQQERLAMLKNYFNVFRCHTINNCTNCCPRQLNPAQAISNLRLLLTNLQNKKKPDLPGAVLIEPEKACNVETDDECKT